MGEGLLYWFTWTLRKSPLDCQEVAWMWGLTSYARTSPACWKPPSCSCSWWPCCRRWTASNKKTMQRKHVQLLKESEEIMSQRYNPSPPGPDVFGRHFAWSLTQNICCCQWYRENNHMGINNRSSKGQRGSAEDRVVQALQTCCCL